MKDLVHYFGHEFLLICQDIAKANKTIDEWAEIESDDLFQTEHYTGGFDSTENAFCFSVIEGGKELWFQLSMEEVSEILQGRKQLVTAFEADL